MLQASGLWLTAVLCVAEVLTMTGFSAYSVLLAPLRDRWGLSNADAGLIGGMFFAGYTAAVPILVGATDRIGSRRVWTLGAGLTIAGTGCFGLFAHGLASAAVSQAIAGAGLAGTYMPGLRLLADHLPARAQSRAVALYTASFGVGTAGSYLIAGHIAGHLGWRATFLMPAGTTGLAILLVLLSVQPARLTPQPNPLRGIGKVLRHRGAIAYSIAYFAHSWEIYTIRSWIIAFLGFVGARSAGTAPWPSPANVAFAMAAVGIFSIVIGNECSIRFGRKLTIGLLMSASAAAGVAVGLIQSPYPLIVALVMLHGVLLTSESASVTAGALGNALPGRRGATLAVHSMLGFAGGAVGPLAFGAALDFAGGARSSTGWTAAYVALAALTLIGPLAMLVLQPGELPGDGRREARGI